jgi:hypothetical protein
MNDIDPQMLLDVLDEVQAEKGYPEKYSVHVFEVFARLAVKGYRPYDDASAIPPAPRPPQQI